MSYFIKYEQPPGRTVTTHVFLVSRVFAHVFSQALPWCGRFFSLLVCILTPCNSLDGNSRQLTACNSLDSQLISILCNSFHSQLIFCVQLVP